MRQAALDRCLSCVHAHCVPREGARRRLSQGRLSFGILGGCVPFDAIRGLPDRYLPETLEVQSCVKV